MTSAKKERKQNDIHNLGLYDILFCTALFKNAGV